ncbi:MAG: signal peptidase I [Chloracidobacterium sp.]|nr:signal peptidase I [Chloracidobacterium sp.]
MRRFSFSVMLLLGCIAANCTSAQNIKKIRADDITMSPAIKDGDEFHIDTGFYRRGKGVERFDIISFRLSEEQKHDRGLSGELFYTKRVIGLPNERFQIKDGKVLINNSVLEEPFEQEMREVDDFGPINIPDNEYFVLGDNRPNSFDSRLLKPHTVKGGDVLGKVVQIVPSKN